MYTWSPPPPLNAFIECAWLTEGHVGPAATERVLPHGLVQLIVNLDHARALVVGPRSRFTQINKAETAPTIGILFRPGCAGPFIGMPTSEIYQTDVDLEALWGRGSAAELQERLREAATVSTAFQTLDRALVDHAHWQWSPHPGAASALALLEAGPHRVRIPEISAHSGLGQRRFTDVFRSVTGMSPKRFARVRRFQRLVGRLAQPGHRPWAQLAIDCGYFDQAHMARDFRALAGLSLSEYMALRTAHQNHVRDP